MTDILDDIFEHTDKRVELNTKKFVDYYNKHFGDKMDYIMPNFELEQLLDTDISFPLEYRQKQTFIELMMQTKNKKEKIMKNNREEALKPQGVPADMLPPNLFAQSIL